MSAMAKKVVIIGGVAAGAKAACRIKRRDPHTEVTVIEKGELLSYGACGLPYFVSGIVKDEKELMTTPIGIMRDEGFFEAVKGVTTYTKTKAEAIDRDRKTVKAVHTETGRQTEFPYDKLVLAVGASPVVPPIEGVNLNNIFTLSTIPDSLAIKACLSSKKVQKAVIVGAGLIGMEMAEAFRLCGAEVAVVEMLDWVFPKLIDREFGLLLGRYLEDEGISLFTSEKVVRFEGDENGNVKKIVTDRRVLEADMVVLSIGVRPNVELAKKAGLAIGETGGIQVNDYLQTSDPDIYAGGDCVENTDRMTGNKVLTPLGSTANKHGRVIADQITGDGPSFPGVLGTAVCKVLDYNIARTGLSETEAVRHGFNVESIICPGQDITPFYPGAKTIITKLIAEKESRRILGAQIVGPGDVSKRVDIMAAMLSAGARVEQLSSLDLSYAPPFSPAMDNIITAANVMGNKLTGLAKSVSPLIVKERLDRGDDFIFLDVRTPQEYRTLRIEHPNVTLIPLDELREKCESLPKDSEIIIFCIASLRGYEAQRILDACGFEDVKFMDGGLLAWPFEKMVE